MYYYRNLTPEQQDEVLEYRRQQRRPWHSPPRWNFEGERQFFISGACFEHAHVIGANHKRMTECEIALLEVCGDYASVIYAWCILPNHYHILVKTDRSKSFAKRSAGLTGARHSNGMAKTGAAGGRSGITALTARSNRIAISGRP
jgi:putative transposase